MKLEKKILLANMDMLHTTMMGENRVRRKLNLNDEDVVIYCKSMILNEDCNIYKQGKNFYCEIDNIRITINANSYTIITAHKRKY